MLNEKSMVNMSRPIPLEINQKWSAIEIIKQIKSLTINDSSYNEYFNRYYNITEGETEKSEINKLIKSEETNTQKKNHLSSLLPLQNNNVFMEVMFSKNYQSRVNKQQLESSKISKFHQSTPEIFSSKHNCSVNSTYLPGSGGNEIALYKSKRLKPLLLHKEVKSDEYESSKELILNYLFTNQDLKSKILISEASDPSKLRDALNAVKSFIETHKRAQLEDLISNDKIRAIQIKDYFYKYLRNKQVLLELKPFKIEIANYNENEFYKKDFYLPLDLTLALYLCHNELTLALIVSKLFTFVKAKGFELNKMKITDFNILFESEKQNPRIEFRIPSEKFEMLSFNWLADGTVYDISIFFPKVILKFKEKEARINKLVSFESFLYLYTHGFESWEYYMISRMIEEKQFRDIFMSIVSLMNSEEAHKDEYNIDDNQRNSNLLRTFGSHSPSYFYIDTLSLSDGQTNWVNIIEGYTIEAYDMLSAEHITGEAKLNLAQSKKLRCISDKWKPEDFLKRIISCDSKKVNLKHTNTTGKLDIKTKSVKGIALSRNDLPQLGSDMRIVSKLQTKKGMPGVDKDDQSMASNEKEKEIEIDQEYLKFNLSVLDKLDFSIINFYSRLPPDVSEEQRYNIKVKNMKQHSIMLNELGEASRKECTIHTELCINLLNHQVDEWKYLLADLSKSKVDIANFEEEARETKKQTKFLENKQIKKSVE